ncbi:hypothetical protein PMAYCL1PPCAC_06096 [Pristionchus mayeri]|uniref:NADH dehydrogenase [ubiquinone] iron-sulfur protein 4, mitochondrial n=1 Tax=Pristionchus mayeri TaxID=1317129 RepID=A0AAN5CC52_9BILA|nr:hypothetical protein PMAYCL1PPCAC_06096 [Pristionchus mayeri]
MLRSLTPLVRLSSRAFAMDVHSSAGVKQQQMAGVLGGMPKKYQPPKAKAAKPAAAKTTEPPYQPAPRIARVYKMPTELPYWGWDSTKVWKIDIDNPDCLENDMVGFTPTDPLSDVSMQDIHRMEFPSKEEAVEYCQRNNWAVTLDDI